MTLFLQTDSLDCGHSIPNYGYLVEKGKESESHFYYQSGFNFQVSNIHYQNQDEGSAFEEAEFMWSLEFGSLVLKGDASYNSDFLTYKGEKYKITSWIKFTDKTCWEKNGFNSDDFELGEELGLLSPRNAPELKGEVDFNNMVDDEEQFQIDGENDIVEFEKCRTGCVRECEVIIPGKVYENVPVRINTINNKFATGSIEGVNNVYIPMSVIDGSYTEESNELACESKTSVNGNNYDVFGKYCKLEKYKLNENTQIDYGKRTISEICMMNLIHNPCGKNIWKAIYIHPKVEPFVKAKLVQSTGQDVWCVEIPKQDIGKMIGKNGRCIHKIRKDIIHNYPEMSKYWQELDVDDYTENGWKGDYVSKYIEDGYFPSFDIDQGEDCTRVNIWNDIIVVNINKETDKPMDNRYSGFCPIQGVLKKMYY